MTRIYYLFDLLIVIVVIMAMRAFERLHLLVNITAAYQLPLSAIQTLCCDITIGVVTNLVGNGKVACVDGDATTASVMRPNGIAIDRTYTYAYITDAHAIRRITIADGNY
jgi:hypothetical protein